MNDSLNQLRAQVDAAHTTFERAKATWSDKKAAAAAANALVSAEKNERALGVEGPRPAAGFKLPKTANELAAEAALGALGAAYEQMSNAQSALDSAEAKLLRTENAVLTRGRDEQVRKMLEPKYVARAEARAKLDRAEHVVTCAKRFVGAAADQLKSLEQRAAQAEAADASQMAEMIAKGGLESAQSISGDDDRALTAARRDHSVKAKALATLEAAVTTAQVGLAQAERAVVKAVDQILTDEITARAKKVDDLLNEARRLGVALKYFAVTAQVNGAVVPASTQQVLNRLDLPLISLMETPINLAKTGDSVVYRDWTARRAEMIAGDLSEEPKAA
jgi:hypothetical protein